MRTLFAGTFFRKMISFVLVSLSHTSGKEKVSLWKVCLNCRMMWSLIMGEVSMSRSYSSLE